MRIVGGKVFIDGAFAEADLRIEGEHFVAVEGRFDAEVPDAEVPGEGAPAADVPGAEAAPQPPQQTEEVLDVQGAYIVPGLIDIHFHGCAGSDFCDASPDALATIARWQATQGVTAICPATMTYPESTLAPIMEAAAAFEAGSNEAALVGINMEGPFISPHKAGGQNPAYIQPCDLDMFKRLQDAADGLIKIVDVAPEEAGALDFIAQVSPQVRVSLAHTCADYEIAAEAFAAGAEHLTHTCNAMPGFNHREPGPIGAALDAPHVMAELICDGVHVHPSMVRALFKAFGDDRIVLISDSMEATGLSDGTYSLGGQAVHVVGKEARLENGTIAGSATSLLGCLQTAVRDMGIALPSAIKAATINPARAIGIDNQRGSIAAGKIADALILDDNLNLINVVLRGTLQR